MWRYAAATPAAPISSAGGGDGPGFIFWGLFLAFGLVVAAYVAWMVWLERRQQ